MQRRQLRVFISGGDWGRDVLLKDGGGFVDGVFYKSGWLADWPFSLCVWPGTNPLLCQGARQSCMT
jgi:hypothetical protein